jgi:signal transduction histidine kinase
MAASPLLIILQFHIGDHSRQKFHANWMHRLEKQQLEDQLRWEQEHKLRLKAETRLEAEHNLVAFLLHEIRNPFNGIEGYAEAAEGMVQSMLLDQPERCAAMSGHESLLEWTRNIRSCSKHIMAILDNMLDLGKLEDGQMALDSQPLHLHAVVSSVLVVLRVLVTDEVRLEMDVPADLWIMGDHTRWSQLLINLVRSSSLHYTYPLTLPRLASPVSGVERSQVHAKRLCPRHNQAREQNCGVLRAGVLRWGWCAWHGRVTGRATRQRAGGVRYGHGSRY